MPPPHTYESPSSRALMVAPLPASPPAFEELYSETVGFVSRNLRALGVPSEGLDDAIQDVYLVIHRRLDSFEGRSALTTWIYGIVRRVASEHRRKTERRPAPSDDIESCAADGNPYEDVARLEAGALLERLIMELRLERREVFVMAEIEALSGPQIAEVLDLDVDTVYGRLRTARVDFESLLVRHNAQERWRGGRADLAHDPEHAERRTRCWAALVGTLALKPPAVPALAGPAFAKPALAIGWQGLAAFAVGVVTLTVMSWHSFSTPADASNEGARNSTPRASAVVAPEEATHETAAQASLASPSPNSATEETSKQRPDKASPRAKARPSGRAVAEVKEAEPPVSAPSRVAEEASMLRSAHQNLQIRNFAEVQRLLDQHEALFPKGALAREREALEVALQCAQDSDGAEQARDNFLATFGDHALDTGLASHCKSTSDSSF